MDDRVIFDLGPGVDLTAAQPVSVLRHSQPFAWQPNTLIFRQTFWQRKEYFNPLALSTLPAASGMAPAVSGNVYLVEETDRRDVGGGDIVEWDRIWAHKPATYTEQLPYVYQAQRGEQKTVPWFGSWSTDSNGNLQFNGIYKTFINVSEIAESLTATITYTFYLTEASAIAALQVPWHIAKTSHLDPNVLGNTIEALIVSGVVGLAECTKTRWMGDIWLVKKITVTSAYAGTF